MRLLSIDHVSFNVADRATSLDWYASVLDLRRPARTLGPPDEPTFLGPLGSRVALFGDRAPGLRHVALRTDRAAQLLVVARLDSLGIPYVEETHGDHLSVYVKDPDGATLEVMT